MRQKQEQEEPHVELRAKVSGSRNQELVGEKGS